MTQSGAEADAEFYLLNGEDGDAAARRSAATCPVIVHKTGISITRMR